MNKTRPHGLAKEATYMARKSKEAGFGIIEGIVIVCVLAAAVFAGWYIWNENQKNSKESAVSSFDDCKKAGNEIQLSYPEVCITNDGKRFTNTKQSVEQRFTGAEKQDGQTILKIAEWGVEIPLDPAHAGLVYSYVKNDTYETTSFTFKELQQKNMCKTDVGVSVSRQKTQNEPPFNIDNPQSFKKVGTYYYYIAYGGSPCYDSEKPEEVAAIKQIAGEQDIKQFVVEALKGLRVTDN
jgi:hypothetical protein